MSVLKRKSSIVLIVGIIVMLLLIPVWYTVLVPFFIGSELEKIDSIATMEGSGVGLAFGAQKVPLFIKAHAYTAGVRGDNIIVNVEVNFTNTDTNETLTDFSGNSTFVFNKVTRQYTRGAPEATNKDMTGYGVLYPPHLKAGEDIDNVWADSLNKTVTLKFKDKVVEDGVTLYKYVLNETIEKEMELGPIGRRNCTLTSTKIVLIEPLFGAPAYTQNETFSLIAHYNDPIGGLTNTTMTLLTFRDTDDMKAEGIANAKMAHWGALLMELYIPTIFCVIAIILTIGLAFNIRRLKRKKPLEPKTKPPASK